MLLAILLTTPTLVTPPVGTTPIGPICQNPGTVRAGHEVETPRVRPLGDEPPAQHILAVLRTDFDGCVKPVVVSARVGKR